MPIIWKGWGFLALIIPIGGVLVGQGISSALGYPDDAYYSVSSVTLLVSAVVVWLVGKKLNGAPERLLRDAATGEEVRIKPQHSLFWIPMQWFSLVWAAFAIFTLCREQGFF